MPKFGLGREFVEDKRDKEFSLVVGKSHKLSSYWDGAAFVGNQEDRPSCVGHAWNHWLVAPPLHQRLDPEGIYRIAKHFDEWKGEGYAGTSVRAGAKVLHHLGFIDKYIWTWDLNGLIFAVLEMGPVVVGTNWYESMFEPDREGRLHVYGDAVGGHAYLIDGVDTDTREFRIKSSWWDNDKPWGRNGRATIDFRDMKQLIKENGEVCIAIEKQPEE